MIAIKGINVTDLGLIKDKDGRYQVTGTYKLMSSTDTVLASQDFNGYNTIKVDFTAETQRLLHELTTAIRIDIQSVLGLTEEK